MPYVKLASSTDPSLISLDSKYLLTTGRQRRKLVITDETRRYFAVSARRSNAILWVEPCPLRCGTIF